MRMRFIVALICGCFAGCKTFGSSEGSKDGGVVSQLVGSWSTGCIVSVDSPANSEISFASFTSTTATFRYNQYSDRSCTALIGAGTDVNMSYTVGEIYTPVPGSYAIDQKPTSFFLTPHDQKTVSSFNQSRFCGVATWALNVSQNAGSCTASKSGLTVLSPRYNIVLLSGNNLKMGKIDQTYTGLSIDKRPVVLDQTSVLIKQN